MGAALKKILRIKKGLLSKKKGLIFVRMRILICSKITRKPKNIFLMRPKYKSIGKQLTQDTPNRCERRWPICDGFIAKISPSERRVQKSPLSKHYWIQSLFLTKRGPSPWAGYLSCSITANEQLFIQARLTLVGADPEPKQSRRGAEGEPDKSRRPSRLWLAASCRPLHRQSKHTRVYRVAYRLPESISIFNFFVSWFVYWLRNVWIPKITSARFPPKKIKRGTHFQKCCFQTWRSKTKNLFCVNLIISFGCEGKLLFRVGFNP